METVNNVVVKNESLEMGKRILAAFKKLGVDTKGLNASVTSYAGSYAHYGVVAGQFASYHKDTITSSNARIITIDELEAMANGEPATEVEYNSTNDIQNAIDLLKANGYKVSVRKEIWEEV